MPALNVVNRPGTSTCCVDTLSLGATSPPPPLLQRGDIERTSTEARDPSGERLTGRPRPRGKVTGTISGADRKLIEPGSMCHAFYLGKRREGKRCNMGDEVPELCGETGEKGQISIPRVGRGDTEGTRFAAPRRWEVAGVERDDRLWRNHTRCRSALDARQLRRATAEVTPSRPTWPLCLCRTLTGTPAATSDEKSPAAGREIGRFVTERGRREWSRPRTAPRLSSRALVKSVF